MKTFGLHFVAKTVIVVAESNSFNTYLILLFSLDDDIGVFESSSIFSAKVFNFIPANIHRSQSK